MSSGRLSRKVRKQQADRLKTLDVREDYVWTTGNVDRPAEVIGRTDSKKPEGYKLRPTKRGNER